MDKVTEPKGTSRSPLLLVPRRAVGCLSPHIPYRKVNMNNWQKFRLTGHIMLPIVCAMYVTKFIPDGGFQAGLIVFLAIWIAADGIMSIAGEE